MVYIELSKFIQVKCATKFLLQFKLTLVGSPFYERLPNGVRLNFKGHEQRR